MKNTEGSTLMRCTVLSVNINMRDKSQASTMKEICTVNQIIAELIPWFNKICISFIRTGQYRFILKQMHIQ